MLPLSLAAAILLTHPLAGRASLAQLLASVWSTLSCGCLLACLLVWVPIRPLRTSAARLVSPDPNKAVTGKDVAALLEPATTAQVVEAVYRRKWAVTIWMSLSIAFMCSPPPPIFRRRSLSIIPPSRAVPASYHPKKLLSASPSCHRRALLPSDPPLAFPPLCAAGAAFLAYPRYNRW